MSHFWGFGLYLGTSHPCLTVFLQTVCFPWSEIKNDSFIQVNKITQLFIVIQWLGHMLKVCMWASLLLFLFPDSPWLLQNVQEAGCKREAWKRRKASFLLFLPPPRSFTWVIHALDFPQTLCRDRETDDMVRWLSEAQKTNSGTDTGKRLTSTSPPHPIMFSCQSLTFRAALFFSTLHLEQKQPFYWQRQKHFYQPFTLPFHFSSKLHRLQSLKTGC